MDPLGASGDCSRTVATAGTWLAELTEPPCPAPDDRGVHAWVLAPSPAGRPPSCCHRQSLSALLSGADARQVAGEVVRSRVHQLLQVLQQERRLELRRVDVGGVLLRAEALPGEPPPFRF